MTKDLDKKIKIEPLNDTTFEYIVSRKNFWGNFITVATVTVTPNEDYKIVFLEKLSPSKTSYINKYFTDLVNLKIKLAPNNKVYHIHKGSKLVAIANVYEYEILAVDFLNPDECAYLSRYFRKKFNQTQSTL